MVNDALENTRSSRVSIKRRQFANPQAPPRCAEKDAEAISRYAAARTAEDFDTAAVIAGEAVDLIDDIVPAAEMIRRIVDGAESALERASHYRPQLL